MLPPTIFIIYKILYYVTIYICYIFVCVYIYIVFVDREVEEKSKDDGGEGAFYELRVIVVMCLAWNGDGRKL